MATQRNAYNHLDNESYERCWQWNDQLRNERINNEEDDIWNETMDVISLTAREEAKKLWKIQKEKIQRNVSYPMPCNHPRARLCRRDGCQFEVNWQWGDGKHWCCGDRCVDVETGPNATHQMKMNCIRLELQRYWKNFERELDEIHRSTPPQLPSSSRFSSPKSVRDVENELFSMDDILPMDFDELDLYCDETLSIELKQAGCENLSGDM